MAIARRSPAIPLLQSCSRMASSVVTRLDSPSLVIFTDVNNRLSIISRRPVGRGDDLPPGLALFPFGHWLALGRRPRPVSLPLPERLIGQLPGRTLFEQRCFHGRPWLPAWSAVPIA